MKLNALGKTGIKVTEISLGTLIMGKRQANITVEEGAIVVKKAVELGINFIDTAARYDTQNHIREGLKGFRDKVVLSTKTREAKRELARKDFETSLKELNVEYIDVYQLHLVDGEADLVTRREALDLLVEYKERGLIKAIGASVHKVAGARAVVAHPSIDVLFPVLNSPGLGILDGSMEDMIDVCRRAKLRGMGLMAMKPLAGGHLRESPKEAFDFLKRLEMVDTICVGMKSVAEVDMNISLFEGRPVSKETLAQIETVPRRLLPTIACKGCGTCIEACDQRALSVDVSKADESQGKKGHAVVDYDKCILCGYCAEACPQFALRIV